MRFFHRVLFFYIHFFKKFTLLHRSHHQKIRPAFFSKRHARSNDKTIVFLGIAVLQKSSLRELNHLTHMLEWRDIMSRAAERERDAADCRLARC